MMRSSRTLALLLIALLSTSCQAIGTFGGDVHDDPASTGDESGGGASLSPFLVNGQTDHGHPSVGRLLTNSTSCTATLVGSRTVLTAAHCVGKSGLRFVVGGRTYYPSHYVPHPRCELNMQHPDCTHSTGIEFDIAVVILKNSVANITPSPISTRKPSVGQRLVLVGYGKTSEGGGGSGTKRMGTNTIDAVQSTKLRFLGASGSDSNLCNGDSGGPSFGLGSTGEEVVVGVHSSKDITGCGTGGTDMRVDVFEQWLVASSGGDIRLPGTAAPTPPNNPPPTNGNAGEGDSCSSQGCLSGLACTQLKKSDGSTIGRYCLEKCSNVGGTDSACDGSESCVAGPGSGVCFAPNLPQTGYANLDTNSGGGGSNPPTPPPASATEGQSCKSQGCVAGLHCTTVHTFFSTKKYCMEACQYVGDPACDGGEVCSRSPENKLVCFLSSSPSTGYTNPNDSGGSGGGGGQTNWGACFSGGVQGVCQSTSNSCNGSYKSNLCPGDASIKCCLPPSSGGGGGGGSTPQSCGSSLETAALNALNSARAQRGLSSLGCDSKALSAARAHSQDMCTHNFSGHTGHDGSSLSDRLHRAGASFKAASESIAKGFSSGTSVVNGWMGSAGNQQVLLKSNWTRSGIGMISCGSKKIWTAVVLR
jgi:uncharacterized protein YkwD